ncbi:uncharacterized protein LAESUDRAFT_677793 [Laetiporus sulphureus 93-53]|uniref:Uncharacterized protein n=1 Tax=Laetiporus sulphureus 93-53 TaxID=1314785 RepID=A0A165EML4_9APHY|nr:uncharacterized protein LAESUDRAFT_677793 [Laetiporus sulphureus 93-53]KZT07377.1 hypothetical protein LAESUDRAFT_677793 [Laetiporus sulphureus 93-53]
MQPPTPVVSHRPSILSRDSRFTVFGILPDMYSDSRTHGYEGPIRYVRTSRAASSGGGAIAKNEDGTRCVIAGKESLRILRISRSSESSPTTEYRSAVGKGEYRIDIGRNLWDGSGLHVDSASTDVVWCHGSYDRKILTSARNGELIMWDLMKSGPSKVDRRTRQHSRSIHALAYSTIVQNYCISGSADGELRIWDLRDLTKSIMYIRHPAPIRAVAFSPVSWQPLHAITALENGSMYRWDLKVGQRGNLDRIAAAHSGPILALDWASSGALSGTSTPRPSAPSSWYGGSGTLLDDILPGSGNGGNGDAEGTSLGWLASGGLDRCVKVWNISANKSGISHDPTYTLRTAYPVRRVLWRPGYECELAIVSNNIDSAGSSSADLHYVGGASAGGSAIPGASSGLLSVSSSPRINTATLKMAEVLTESQTESGPQTMSQSGRNDPIELWDVRRGYIAKWAIERSAMEGGVTDVVFGDSHAIWAQYSSGAFAQLDLRQATRPLDAIPRTAMSWTAAGSLAFVTDRPSRWEIPYDDIKPEKRQSIMDLQGNVKSLGDPPYVPVTQNMGAIASEDSIGDLEVFVRLAQGWIYEGGDRKEICKRNAQVSAEAGNVEAAQTWLMLGSLLTDLVQEKRLARPQNMVLPLAHGLLHSASAPASIPTIQTLQSAVPTPQRSVSSDVDTSNMSEEQNWGSTCKVSDEKLGRTSQKGTPTSSTSSSPHYSTSALPASQLSVGSLSRRESDAAYTSATRRRLSSSYRRPSFTTASIYSAHSDSPNASTRSLSSLKHIGEGALDDSDSSDSGGEDAIFDDPSRSGSDGEGQPYRSMTSSNSLSRTNIVTPSPLSQVVGQTTWTEDERDDSDSPSPGSTSESDSSDYATTSLRSKVSRSTKRNKTRSRSSTVASLAAPSSTHTLVKQDSYSSIRTVTAGNPPGLERGRDHSFRGDISLRSLLDRPESTKALSIHQRAGSVLSNDMAGRSGSGEQMDPELVQVVRETESRFRELGWEAFREMFEAMAGEGEIQLCTYLSVVAPKELKVDRTRALQLVESYIDVLSRLRLHTSAAYMRKFAQADDVRATTALHTTVHTSCSRCRKPILTPTVDTTLYGKPSGGYAYCTSCKINITTCSICHLPVRALMFKCPVCMHGGHEECYRNYYLHRPMEELKAPPVRERESQLPRRTTTPELEPAVPHGVRGRAMSRADSITGDSESDESIPLHAGGSTTSGGEVTDTEGQVPTRRALYGHLCAAGCGHHCWAVSKQPFGNLL